MEINTKPTETTATIAKTHITIKITTTTIKITITTIKTTSVKTTIKATTIKTITTNKALPTITEIPETHPDNNTHFPHHNKTGNKPHSPEEITTRDSHNNIVEEA